MGSAPTSAAALTVTVDSVADFSDANPGDGVCAVAGSGLCTLRAAIEETEANAGNDTINFNIVGAGTQRISLGSKLPLIASAGGVTIDATTQPGSQVNTLDRGTNAVIGIEIQGGGPNQFEGFDIRSSGSVIRGVAMFDFRASIRIEGGSNNVIVGSKIGTDAFGGSGQPASVPGQRGLELEFGASDNVIGAPGNANRNIIAGNGEHGIGIYYQGSNRNTIQNNVFGLSADGSARVTNFGHAIDINFNSSDNLVGGSQPGEGNVISGSKLSGVEISHDSPGGTSRDNLITGNLIGTNLDGTSGPEYAANLQFGINFEGNERCADMCPADVSFNRAENNVIAGSKVGVMVWKGAHDNTVANNRIGVLDSGEIAESSARTLFGVLISTGAHENLVTGNTIAGVQRGIHIRPDNIFPSDCLGTDITCPADASFDTFANTFVSNSISSITNGLGIDLYSFDTASNRWVDGPRLAPSPLVNGGIATPTIDAATAGRVVVSTCAGCSVEVFETAVPTCTQCWEAYGRGRRSLGTSTANSSGVATFSSSAVAAGIYIAAHTTDAAGNTSEHSLRVQVGDAVDDGFVINEPAVVDTAAAPGRPAGPRRAMRCDYSDGC